MYRTNFENAVLQELRNAQALRAGVGEVELARDAMFEQVEMLRAADAGNDHVQLVDDVGIHLGQRAGQEVCLLLVVAFHGDPVAGRD